MVQRHQAWIYNIAVRMLYHPQMLRRLVERPDLKLTS
jgi:hypothetical protein